MLELLSFFDQILWGSVLIYLLLGTGIYFTFRTRFIQIRHFGHMFSVLKNSNRTDRSGISSFQALCTTLAARVGTGNLAGVALALTMGGPGAIFWMWVVAFIGMATSFAESTLAQLYKVRDKEGRFRGGPAYYMEKGLGVRWLGVIFAFCLIITFGLVFNAVQSNSIAQATSKAFDIAPFNTGIFLAVLSGVIIFGGIRTIAKAAELIVPFMAIAYLILAFWVIGHHIERLPDVFILIVKSAFGLQEAVSGAVAYSFTHALLHGVQRGLFSNEAGMGSAPNAAATATPYPPHPVSQGYVQMLGVFFDTIVICTATAAIILVSGALDNPSSNGINLTQQALNSSVGGWGGTFVAIAIFFFAFTSIIANYAYAENNLVFLEHNKTVGLVFLRIAALGMVIFGALADVPIVWKIANISMAFMALINLVAILLLSGIVVKLANDYNHQRKLGHVPKFDVNLYPEIHSQLEPDIWNKPQEK